MLNSSDGRTWTCEEDYMHIEDYVVKPFRWYFPKPMCDIFKKAAQKWSQLNDFEAREICLRPWNGPVIFDIANQALKMEKAYFKSAIGDAEGNAYRHCFMVAVMAQTMARKEIASFLNGREMGKKIAPEYGEDVDSRSASREMDVHNNNVGYDVGLLLKEGKLYSLEEVDRRCIDKLNAGELKVIKPHFKLPIKFDKRHVLNL